MKNQTKTVVSTQVEKVSTLLAQPGMIPFEQFSNVKALSEAGEWLATYLKQAKNEFKTLLQVPIEEATYETVGLAHLTSGSALSIMYSFIDTLNSVCADEQTRVLIEKFEPQVVAFGNEVLLNEKLYALLCAALKKTKKADEKRSLTLLIREMKHAGVELPAKKRLRIAAINERLSVLSQRFENNVIDSRKLFSYEILDESVLGFMPESDKAQAREQAQSRKQNGFVFTLLPPQYASIMKFCTDRTIRELFYKKNNETATSGKFDNRPLILEILKLRSEKARLLGHKSFADYALELRMAKHPQAVLPLLDKVYEKAQRGAKNEIAELEGFAREAAGRPLGKKEKFEEWDLGFYSDHYKRQKFSFDESTLRNYFELGRVTNGLFAVAKKLYNLSFKEMSAGAYAPGVKTYEVYQGKQLISYYIADFYARPTKRGGAWCNVLREGYVYVSGKKTQRCLPIVINVMNFPEPTKKHPALLMHRDVETLFHEFGHAVHAMLSSNQLPNLNGFHVEWDFVEFPSQIFENWTWEREVLNLFARHYETNELLPQKDLDTLWKLKTYMGGYHVVRQNEFGYLDMKLHTLPPPRSVAALDALCEKVVAGRTVLKKPHNYRMYASFGHIFAGGYSAAYYSYLWAEILEADCYAYLRSRGILKASTGKLFADHILAPGTSEPGEELFRSLMKRKANISPLLEKYGIK